MQDSGIHWWFDSQIYWDDPVFINLDIWSASFSIEDCIKNAIHSKVHTACSPLILHSSFVTALNKPNLESRFPGLENELSRIGYVKSRDLTNSLRLHSSDSHGTGIFVFVSNGVPSKSIPLRMQLTAFAIKLHRLFLNVTEGLKNHFLRKKRVAQYEHRNNQNAIKWREKALKALHEKHEFMASADVIVNQSPEITFKNKKYTFYDTTNYRQPNQLVAPYNEAYFSTGGHGEEVAFTITNIDDNHSESEPSIPLSQPKIVISTLVFNDFMFIEPWIAHYRKYGIAHFLIYFNHDSVPVRLNQLGKKNKDITVIPWGLTYSHRDSKIGKWSWHVAQPMQLHHSVILSKKKALGTHMLYIDVDEYIIGPTPLNELVNMDTDEIGFTNVWASSESDVDLISSQTLVDPKVDFTREHRKKSLRSLQLPGKWNIHGNAGQESIVTTHVMLHFGDIMKFESGSNFFGRGTGYKEHLQPISSLSDQHPLRDIFESQL